MKPTTTGGVEQDKQKCLCLYAIKQTPGEPVIHDLRCEVGRAPGTIANWANVSEDQWHYVSTLQEMVAARDNALISRAAELADLREANATLCAQLATVTEELKRSWGGRSEWRALLRAARCVLGIRASKVQHRHYTAADLATPREKM